MAQLTPVVDNLEAVPETMRTYYVQKDGKYHLDLNGSPAGYVAASELATANQKVVEFRDNNIRLKQENDTLQPLKTKFDGIDADQARADRAKVVELEKKGVKTTDDLTTQITTAVNAAVKPLNEALLNEQKLREQERVRADESTLRSVIGEKFSKAGGRATALDFIFTKSKDTFEVKDGKVAAKPNMFSTTSPGNPIDLDEWFTQKTKEFDFAFTPSTGGGAENRGNGSASGLKAGQVVLQDPTAQQLGDPANAKLIREGKMVVRYTGV